ncbi:MAG: hypothetical protein GVY30_00010 [Chloroflexi bacterium]|jgi:hypothetical protein|nr:hypothetical protein [Chloroflexota bacterium]
MSEIAGNGGAAKVANLEVDDAIVLLLGSPSSVPSLSNQLKGVTRLEKLLFLIEKETDLAKLLEEDMGFSAHNFGPFSAKIYQMLEVLASAGLLEDSSSYSSTTEDSWEASEVIGEPVDPYATRDFKLTARGQKYYKALISELPMDTEVTISRFKERFGALPLRQLIRYVYQKYPKYTEKSLIKDEVL